MMKFNREEGLTLIELLITISVLAIVSAIALPVINNVVSSSNSNALVQTQNDINDFVAKYNAAGAVGYDKGSQSLMGYVDTDGDNQVDFSTELVDTLTIDSKFVIPQGMYGSFTANYGSPAGAPTVFLAGTNGY